MIHTYITQLDILYHSGKATEHSYRPELTFHFYRGEELLHYATIGKYLRELHLLESPQLQTLITSFPYSTGGNTITEIKWVDTGQKNKGNVYINDTQYFQDVPLKAWEAYIGGYQPAQKWLKDRKGHILNYDDIMHYQQMIVALTKMQEVMKN